MPNDTTDPTIRDVVDLHFHVGPRGEPDTEHGGVSDTLRNTWPLYDIMLLYLRIKKGEDTDEKFKERVIDVITGATSVGRAVCLELDHVWDENGDPHWKASNFWVRNQYVLDLVGQHPDRMLYGASVHPFRNDFEEEVQKCVDQGAVLLKWLPSAQQFSLEQPKVRSAMKFLATAKSGAPLPLLLHVGYEGAIPTTRPYTQSYDFLSWSFWDGFRNFWRFGKKWHTPNLPEVRRTLDEALEAGAVIIFAHVGLPYFFAHAEIFEHSDFPTVREYLERTAQGKTAPGRCYADVSACATPFRRAYFENLAKLPRDLLLFGSDFPTPVFELSADLEEAWDDFKAIMDGKLKQIVIPEDNLIDVNHRELHHFFPDHPMFTNFARQLL
jgi:predicted TIM-barrel fold metal-dependent hydrolase